MIQYLYSMKHTFFTFIALLSFVVVSVGVPRGVRAEDASTTGFDIESSLSDMTTLEDLTAIALTCAAGPQIMAAVTPAVSAVTGTISDLFTIVSDTTSVTAATELAAATAATAAAVAAAAAGTTEVAAAAAPKGAPTYDAVLEAAHGAQLIHDAAQTTLLASATTAKEPKEVQSKMTSSIFDCIVYNAGQQMLTQLTDNTVSWIQGGFNGSPSFSVNTHEIFLDLADMVAGDLARELRGIAMCDFSVNFKNDLSNTVELSGKKEYRFNGKTKCPFPETFDVSSSDFYKGVNNFSWAAMEYAMQDSGNPFGIALLTGEELQRRASEKKEVREQELSWSNGFTNIVDTENCKYRTSVVKSITGGDGTTITQAEWDQAIADEIVTSAEAREYQKTYCKTTTPGKVLGDKLGKALDVDMERLGMIDNINKIIGAFINQVTKEAALGIFNAVSGEDAELEVDYVTVNEKTAQTIAMENAAIEPYYNAWQDEIEKQSNAEEELARLEAEKAATTDVAQLISLEEQISAQQAIIDAAPERIEIAKAAYDEASSAEQSIARQAELVAAQAEYDAAYSAYKDASTNYSDAQEKYNDYLSGSLSSGGDYIPPDSATLEVYAQEVTRTEDEYNTAKTTLDSASNRLYSAENPAYVAPQY